MRRPPRFTYLPCRLLFAGLMLSAGPAAAQEQEPRAYWPTLEGTNVLVLGYQGDKFFHAGMNRRAAITKCSP